MYQSTPDTHECDGMCFSPARVLTEIHTLAGAYLETGMPVGTVPDNFYIQEVTRTMSSIAIACRQQMTSYFHDAAAKGIALENRLEYIQQNQSGATAALQIHTADLNCPQEGIKHINFYDLANKLCHVETWRYPVIYHGHTDWEDSEHDKMHRLAINVTKRRCTAVSGQTEEIVVFVNQFINAARIFITSCEECEVYGRPFDVTEAGADCVLPAQEELQ